MSNIKDSKYTLRNFFSGQFSRYALNYKLIPLLVMSFSLCIAISWIFYPNYNWTQMEISKLGDPQRNPIGWIFFSVGLITIGALILPIIPFIHRRLVDYDKIITKIGTSFLYFAAFGMIGVGVIPQFEALFFKITHIINSGLAFGGLYLGLLFWGVSISKNKKLHRKLILVAIFGWGAPIGFIVTQSIRLLKTPIEIIVPWYYNFSTWEWMLLFGIFSALLILIYIVPEEIAE